MCNKYVVGYFNIFILSLILEVNFKKRFKKNTVILLQHLLILVNVNFNIRLSNTLIKSTVVC